MFRSRGLAILVFALFVVLFSGIVFQQFICKSLALVVYLLTAPNSSAVFEGSPRFERARQEVQTTSVKDLKSKANRLQRLVDRTLIEYRSGEIVLRQAIERIENPYLLKGSGYLLDPLDPPLLILDEPNDSMMEEVPLGMVVHPFRRVRPHFASYYPGFLYDRLVIVRNGHDLFSQENLLLAEEILRTRAEERYHVVQGLRRLVGIGGNAWAVSDFFKRPTAPSFFLPEFKNQGKEADVYARLLEVLGPDRVPDGTRRRYPERRMVPTSEIHPVEIEETD